MKINYEWRQCWRFLKEKLITNHTLSVFEFENNYESLKSSKSSMIELRKWKILKILKIEILFFYVELMMEMVIWSLNSVPIMWFPWKLWSKNLYFRNWSSNFESNLKFLHFPIPFEIRAQWLALLSHFEYRSSPATNDHRCWSISFQSWFPLMFMMLIS